MAAPSRLYLRPSGGTPGITPTPDTQWEQTTGFGRVVPSLTKQNTAFAQSGFADSTATANRDVLMRQFVYPLVAGTAFTTAHTFKGRILAFEGASASNLRSQCIIRVIGSDGSTVRATLFAGDLTTGTNNPTSEWNLSAPRNVSPTTSARAAATITCAANYTAVAGDHLVIEIGYRKHAAANTTGTIRLGDTTASSDLPENETQTTDGATWFEFSGDLDPPVQKASSDSITAVLTEVASVESGPTPQSSSDTVTAELSESASVAAAVGSSDTITAALSESGSVARASGSTDDITAVLTESASVAVAVASSDSITAALTEVASVAAIESKASSDAIAATLTDVAAVAVAVASSDSMSVTLTDVASVARSSESTDAIVVALTDVASVAVSVFGFDAIGATLTDVASVARASGTSDTITAGLADVASVAVAVSSSDAIGAVLTEVASVVSVDVRESSDAIAVSLSESASIHVSLAPADTVTFELTEVASVVVHVASFDVVTFGLVEVGDVSEPSVPIASSDSIAAEFDHASVLDVSVFGFDAIAALFADSLSVDTGAIITPLYVGRARRNVLGGRPRNAGVVGGSRTFVTGGKSRRAQ
jgi:hypothetical protein